MDTGRPSHKETGESSYYKSQDKGYLGEGRDNNWDGAQRRVAGCLRKF